MSNVLINWEIDGLDPFALRLEKMAYNAINTSPALKEVGEMWVGWIEEQFETQGVRFLGHKWTKLARDTQLRRKAAGPILIEDANLLLEVTNPDNVSWGDDEVVLEIADDQAKYGGFHQTGTGRMPERPIFLLNEHDARRSLDVVEEWLFEPFSI